MAKEDVTPQTEVKPLTNIDILASHNLVEIYDATVGAYRQVPKEQAEKMVENLEQLKAAMEGDR